MDSIVEGVDQFFRGDGKIRNKHNSTAGNGNNFYHYASVDTAV